MAASVDSPSPSHLTKVRNPKGSMASPSPPPPGSSSSPLLFSSDSDKHFWSSLRNRADVLLENNQHQRLPSSGQDQLNLIDPSSSVGRSERAKRMKEDSLLLLRGFDSVSQTLSELSNNLGNALQGARSLAEPPTLSEMLQSKTNNSEAVQEKDLEARENDSDEEQKGLKRKFEPGEDEDASRNGVDDLVEAAEEISKNTKLKKAKNMAVSLAIKAASLAREMKSVRSDLSFMQERCVLLEEENRRLRDGFSKGIRPEEDDLMRLQMEFLLAEKSRLATENANLVRENQCLHQLVEYHQAASQDISASYEEVLQGICLDFGSPSSQQIKDEDDGEEKEEQHTSESGIARLAASLDVQFDQEQGH